PPEKLHGAAESGTAASPVPAAPEPKQAPTPLDASALKKEIKGRIRAMMLSGLDELKLVSAIQILTDSHGDPSALGIPSGLLFQSGDTFRKSAPDLLNALAKIVYGNGRMQVVLLPE